MKIRTTPEQNRSKSTVLAIKSAAVLLFNKAGIDQISMTMIAQEAGVSKPAIYRYFKNKQVLIRELAIDNLSYFQKLIAESAKIDVSEPKELFLKLIKMHCDIYLNEPFRLQLRGAINADPVLAQLDFEDSKVNANAIANLMYRAYPNATKSELDCRALLITELSDSLIRLYCRAEPELRQDILEVFVDRFCD